MVLASKTTIKLKIPLFSCEIKIFVVSLQKEFMNPLEKVDSNIENKKSNKSSS